MRDFAPLGVLSGNGNAKATTGQAAQSATLITESELANIDMLP
jgi:hypothetical protein